MGNAKHIGRVGALAAALGIGNVRRTATRMTVSIGVAALVVMATVVPVSTASAAASTRRRVRTPTRLALILGGTSFPTPDDFYVESVKNQFIAPTHPGQNIEYVAVTTPEELWPLTGLVPPPRARAGAPRASSGLVAQRGRTSRCGNSQGSSTSPRISRCRPGWPIWRRRWPSTPTTIW